MIRIPGMAGKNVGVLGLGKAGQAGVAALVASGARVFAWDDSGAARAGMETLRWQEWPWENLEFLLISPGIPLTHACPEWAYARDVPTLGEVELLWRAQPHATFIGITGTNGKSTTTSLIGHILEAAGKQVQIGGNLGVPALALEPLGPDGIYVLEMSSYQLDLIHDARFHIALLLNLTPDHLDRHGDMQGYITAKKRIFANQREDDIAIIALDDEYTGKLASEMQRVGSRRLIGISTDAQPTQASIWVDGEGKLHDDYTGLSFGLSPIPSLQGRHNWQNAAAAYAACHAAGIAPETIFHAMQSFAGLAHRMERVGELHASGHSVLFINDSKATNADATQHALATFDTIYWILGGVAKAGGIESLERFFPKIAHAFLIGEATEAFAKTLAGKVPYTACDTLEAAAGQAAEMAFKDKNFHAPAVVLSPACASFDQFKSFEHRGDRFRELVKGMTSSRSADFANAKDVSAGSHAMAEKTMEDPVQSLRASQDDGTR